MLNKCLLLLPAGLPKPGVSLVWFSLHVPSLCVLQNINKSLSLTMSPCFPTSMPLPMFHLHGMSLGLLLLNKPLQTSRPTQHFTRSCLQAVIPPSTSHTPVHSRCLQRCTGQMTPHQDWNGCPAGCASLEYNNYRRTLSSPRI